jgi:hypothetical protein
MSRLWPFSRESRAPAVTRGRPAASPGPATAPPVSAIRFRSWALSDMLRRRLDDRPWRVLDLGSVNTPNFHFFTERGGYAVEELLATVSPCRTAGLLDAGCVGRLPNLLSFRPGTRFDAVFAWDLFDYLGAAAVTVLGQRLTAYCHPRTLVYAAVSRETRIPVQPGRWEIVDEQTIQHQPSAPQAMLPSPRFVDATLQRALADFRVHKSYLLQHGLQEYLLEPAG